MAMLRCNALQAIIAALRAPVSQPSLVEPVTGVGTSWSIAALQPPRIHNDGGMQ
jgi:hypothetical protein